MNKDRRKAIDAAKMLLDDIRSAIDAAKEAIETIKDEEQDYFDNMPESFQQGDKGDTAQSAIDNLDNAMSELDGFDVDALDSYLDEAAS